MFLRLAIAAALLIQNPATPTPNPFAPLTVYNGSWTVTLKHPPTGSTGSDHLVNHCHQDDAFYTCEQVVNGKPAALIIFTLGKGPGLYDVDNVTPNGHASSNTDLIVAGNRWTFLTNDDNRKPHWRTINTFISPDHIHFESAESSDGGATWTTTNEGETVRER